MTKLFLTLALALAYTAGDASRSLAQSDFYEGKTMRIIVGFSPGGGYDALARMLSRHMPKHIPGRPTILVENMTGAGSLLAANHIYKIAKPDGLTMGHFSGGFAFNQVMGQPGIELDTQKFVYVGAVARDESAIAMSKASGITSMEKWFAAKTPVKLGTTGPGAFGTDNVIKVIKAALNLPIQIIAGYKGTADMRLATESGEIDGTTWGWDSMRGTWQKAIESGTVVVVLQTVPKPFPDLPRVPLAIDLAKTPEAKQLIEVGIHFPSKITKTLALPPATPADRAQLLQKALQETVKDPEFIAEADKAKIGLAPVTAEEMKRTVDDIFKLDAAILAKLKTILF
ncbi:MAG TPA: tripartite tricarboxylate transporter substrate-binding protein [Candidatus Binatia bacterium]|nr:tripartite tricarboxylate transporter substrate-binding protein [Candidatus Binatia bacterium]